VLTPYPLGPSTPTPGTAVGVGVSPQYVALTPDGSEAFVTNSQSGTVSVIGTSTGTKVTLPVGTTPEQIAVSPQGHAAYVVDSGSHDVRPIDTQSLAEGSGQIVGVNPYGIAISPDGQSAYVTDSGSAEVIKLTLPSMTVRSVIPVGLHPEGIAITPDGATIYVVNSGSSTVTPISTATGTPEAPINVGTNPSNIAMSPDGTTALVMNSGSPVGAPTVTVLNIMSGATQIVQLPVGDLPTAAAWTPDGSTAWVTSTAGNAIVPLTVTHSSGGAVLVSVGTAVIAGACGPVGIAATPDQTPVAALTQTIYSTTAGGTVTFNASPSTVAYGTITKYGWFFGDGTSTQTDCSTNLTCYQVSHTYSTVGSYTMILYEQDTAGTNVTTVYTGQTVSRNAPKNAFGLVQDSAEAVVTVGSSSPPPPVVPLPWNQPVLYTANILAGTLQPVGMPVTGVPIATPSFGASVSVGNEPAFVAVTPDGAVAAVTNYQDDTVQPVGTCPSGNPQTYSFHAGTAVPTGSGPAGLAIAPVPVGQTASEIDWGIVVADAQDSDIRGYELHVPTAMCSTTPVLPSLTPVWDLRLPIGNTPAGPSAQPGLPMGIAYGIAITPNDTTAFVTDYTLNAVTPVNLTNLSVGAPIPVGQEPEGIAITPDGRTVYVADTGANAVTPIDTTHDIPGSNIPVGTSPDAIAITPDGQHAYVANSGSNSVSDITLATSAVQTIPLAISPTEVTVSADASTAWVSSCGANALVPISVANDSVDNAGVVRGLDCPLGLAMTPDQTPVARLLQTSIATTPGTAVTFDASPSTVRFGQIVEYGWFFGDGTSTQTFCANNATCYQASHTYGAAGTYNVIMYEVDTVGTNVSTLFTGQTVSRYAPPNAAGIPQDAAEAVVSVTQPQPPTAPIPIVGTVQLLYTTNYNAGTVTPVGLTSSGAATVGPSFTVGAGPATIAVTTDGRAAIVTDFQGNSVTPVAICQDHTTGDFKFAAGTAVGTVDPEPLNAVIVPTSSASTWNVYVTLYGGAVVEQFQLTVDSSNCKASISVPTPIAASLIPVGQAPYGIAVTANGTMAYVSNSASATVTPITLNTSSPGGSPGAPIPVGQTPEGVAISADGATVVVANSASGTITQIATSSNTPSVPNSIGADPTYVAITSRGAAYVTTPGSNSLSVFSLANCSSTNCPVQAIGVGSATYALAFSPDGSTVWCASPQGGYLVPVTVRTNTVNSNEIVRGLAFPLGLASAHIPPA
jgi:YVTN family beta-propeller protein